MSEPSDPSYEDSSDSLICEEIMEESPEVTIFSCETSSSDNRHRLVAPTSNYFVVDPRSLLNKLQEQRIWTNVDSWRNAEELRWKHWMRVFGLYYQQELSLSSLQLAMCYMDRFMHLLFEETQSPVDNELLDIVFDAVLVIVEQILSDAPCEVLVQYLKNEGYAQMPKKDLNDAIALVLKVTQWNVIEWTPSSFISHFLEECKMRQMGGDELCRNVQLLTTVLMIDIRVAANYLPAMIAAFAVVLHTWILLSAQFPSWTLMEINEDYMVADDAFDRTLDKVLGSANISHESFLAANEYILGCLLSSPIIEGFDRSSATQFFNTVKAFSGPKIRV